MELTQYQQEQLKHFKSLNDFLNFVLSGNVEDINKSLGITDEMYTNPELVDKWYDNLVDRTTISEKNDIALYNIYKDLISGIKSKKLNPLDKNSDAALVVDEEKYIVPSKPREISPDCMLSDVQIKAIAKDVVNRNKDVKLSSFPHPGSSHNHTMLWSNLTGEPIDTNFILHAPHPNNDSKSDIQKKDNSMPWHIARNSEYIEYTAGKPTMKLLKSRNNGANDKMIFNDPLRPNNDRRVNFVYKVTKLTDAEEIFPYVTEIIGPWLEAYALNIPNLFYNDLINYIICNQIQDDHLGISRDDLKCYDKVCSASEQAISQIYPDLLNMTMNKELLTLLSTHAVINCRRMNNTTVTLVLALRN